MRIKIFIFVASIWQIFITTSVALAVASEPLIDGIESDLAYPVQRSDPDAEYEGQEVPVHLNFDEASARFRRSSSYKVLESAGLHSHFRANREDEKLKLLRLQSKRTRRATPSRSELHSDEVEDLDSESRKLSEGDNISVESIPKPEKQASNPAYYRSDDSRLMDKWVKSPYGDYQSKSDKESDDTQSEASNNVGKNSRTPRVNFITQQGQSQSKSDDYDGPEAREKQRQQEQDRERERERERERDRDRDRDTTKPQPDDTYRKPIYDRPSPGFYGNKNYDYYSPNNYISPYDRYNPANPYYRDRYYDRDYAPPYQQGPAYPAYPYADRDYLYGDRAPHGMSRMVPPGGPSSAFYYRHQYNDFDDYYPRSVPNNYYYDKRFDYGGGMEPREFYDRQAPLPGAYPNGEKPGRIIYYANLPEVVRTPNNYRSATARYGEPMYYPYDGYRREQRTLKSSGYPYRDSRDLPPASTTLRATSSTARNYYK